MKFASANNLRVAVKSSGHDYLWRSTAPNSLLIRTLSFQNLSFTDAFVVGGQDMGTEAKVDGGVHTQTLPRGEGAGKDRGARHGGDDLSGWRVCTRRWALGGLAALWAGLR